MNTDKNQVSSVFTYAYRWIEMIFPRGGRN